MAVFPDSYFETEIREGFEVQSMMKRAQVRSKLWKKYERSVKDII